MARLRRNVACSALLAHAGLNVLGRRAGSASEERWQPLTVDAILPHPNLLTNRAITMDAPPDVVWCPASRLSPGDGTHCVPARCGAPTR